MKVVRKGYLRGQPSGVVGQQGVNGGGCACRLHHAAQVEISDLDPPVALHQHVGGLQVAVQDSGLVRVQMQHTLKQTGGL